MAVQRKRAARSVAARGERALLARLPGLLPREPRRVTIGRGADDCAALDLGGREWTLITCDTLVEGTHFQLDWIDARTLGRRAAAVNLSDIAAMGGKPQAAVVSLAMPRHTELSFYDGFMRGLGARLDEFGAAVVGGNLARAQRHLTIDVTLLGSVEPGRCVRRAGARPGDRVLVTGFPGESAAGLARLQRGVRRRERLVRRFLDPEPRVLAARVLASGGVTAMIDVSDGIAADLEHLCEASGVGARLDATHMPLSQPLRRAAAQLGVQALHLALHGGEDYELLCTAPPRRVAAMQRRLQRQFDLALTEIGEIRRDVDGIVLESEGRRKRLRPRGFAHFG